MSDHHKVIPYCTPRTQLIILITLCWVVGMFLPRVLIEGMFFDGLIYSSIARNLAEGQGSLWHLVFSERSSLLGYFVPNNFTDHPPLVFLTQSWLFRVVGDVWWVEKLYCSIILALTVLVFVAVWREWYRHDNDSRSAWWFAVVLWYACPTVLWGYPYNQLDAPMALWDLCAVYCAVRAVRKEYNQSVMQSASWALLAGVAVLCAFMTKGPVGLYPLAITPVLWLTRYQRCTFSQMATYLALMVFVLVIGGFALYSYEPARNFMMQYLSNQIGGALGGKRVQELGASRLDFFRLLSIELAPMLLISALSGGVAWWMRTKHAVQFSAYSALQRERIRAIAFLAVLASFPIMVSLKQSAHYLAPSLPLYAMAFASVCLPFVNQWWKGLEGKALVRSRIVLSIVFVAILGYSATRFGVPARQGEIIRDLRVLPTFVEHRSTLYAPEDIANNHEIAAYFERYGHYTILIGTPADGAFLVEQRTPLYDSLYRSGAAIAHSGFERFAIVRQVR